MKVDVSAGVLLYAVRQIYKRVRKSGPPLRYPPVVKAIRSNDPARPTDPLDLNPEFRSQVCRRMDEQTFAGEPNNRHTRWKWHRRPRHAKPDNWTVHDPEVLRDTLERVQRRIGNKRSAIHLG